MTSIRKWVSGVAFALVILLTPLFSKAFQSDSTNPPPTNPPPTNPPPTNPPPTNPPPTNPPPSDPPPPPPNPLPPGSQYAPIDSGIVFLLIAGLGLGVITVVAKRKDQAVKKDL